MSRLSPLEWAALAILLAVTLVAIAGPLVAPYDPFLRVGRAFQAPSARFWLGTDEIGRDLLSRILLGIRLTWLPGLAIIAAGVVVGATIGLISGAAGGVVDFLLQRLTELFQVVPATIVALSVAATLGHGIGNLIFAVSLFWWPWYSRLVRSEIRVASRMPHVEAARLGGVSHTRLLLRYLLPAAIPTLIVTATLDVANVVLILSLFSFLGLGAPAPAPELGAMAARSLENLVDFWWLPVAPAVVLLALVLSANIAGDLLRRKLERL